MEKSGAEVWAWVLVIFIFGLSIFQIYAGGNHWDDERCAPIEHFGIPRCILLNGCLKIFVIPFLSCYYIATEENKENKSNNDCCFAALFADCIYMIFSFLCLCPVAASVPGYVVIGVIGMVQGCMLLGKDSGCSGAVIIAAGDVLIAPVMLGVMLALRTALMALAFFLVECMRDLGACTQCLNDKLAECSCSGCWRQLVACAQCLNDRLKERCCCSCLKECYCSCCSSFVSGFRRQNNGPGRAELPADAPAGSGTATQSTSLTTSGDPPVPRDDLIRFLCCGDESGQEEDPNEQEHDFSAPPQHDFWDYPLTI